jgi:elongation factor G
MAVYKQDKIRNIALIGHSGEGKTSLLEAILFATKAIDRLGRVDDGNTVSDYDAEEISRKISISMSLSYAFYKDIKINILDTPGFFDFEGEMVSALTVADAAIIVAGAMGTVTVGAEKAIEYCTEKSIPFMIFINGINKENSDYFKTVEAFKEKYPKAAPIALPIMEGLKMAGYVDVIENKAYKGGAEVAVPANLADLTATTLEFLTEAAAEADEALMEKYFETMELSVEERKQGLKANFVVGGGVMPIVPGIVVGTPELGGLFKYIDELFPTPAEGKGLNSSAGVITAGDGKVCLQVFKSIADQFAGKLLLFKVARGKIATGEALYNSNKEENEKIASMYIIRGKKQDAAAELYAGDMGALAKLNYTSTGDTLCDSSDKLTFNAIDFPQPVISMAIVAEERGAEDKVIAGLTKLLDEDGTFKLSKNIETNEMLISGMGESQLDVLCKKLKNKFKVGASLAVPRVPYRETIKKSVDEEGKHKKQSGGRGQFGKVNIRFEPLYEGEFEFVDEVVGGVVPKQYIPAVEKGLRECLTKGVLAGYPMTGLKATLHFGAYHDVDSDEMSFKLAASIAYREGLPKASPILLEPIMAIKVTVPDNYMGDIMGDMNKRRGRIMGIDNENGKSIINAETPHVELLRYATDLRSMTQGRGKFSMEFSRYEEVPATSASKIVDDYKKRQAENN